MMVVIKYPDRTKNISTPRKPPGSQAASMWKIMTAKTANARMPSKSGRYFNVVLIFCNFSKSSNVYYEYMSEI